jgi:hypothetical protein
MDLRDDSAFAAIPFGTFFAENEFPLQCDFAPTIEKYF